MAKSVDAFRRELTTIRTGRANPALLDRVQVEYYGALTPLQSIASISAPEARLLVVQPYDRSSIGAVEKAILKTELGFNPSNDGQLIRIAVPPLTEERRKEFVRLVHRRAEEARVAVRNIRRDEVDHLRRLEKEGHIGKDEIERTIARIQKITDSFVAKIDEAAQKKEAEITEV
ncbi:MAG TPA: ribosome recycling factor [Candidatus Sulfotelmatobacter sp.]|nr:ribosome recycling factor [Candidatus Sulfotelmatobacter sp.]